MQIAYVCADRGVPVFGRSGSATHVREFARALIDRGVGLTLLAARPADVGSEPGPAWSVVALEADPVLQRLRKSIAKELRREGYSPARAAETYSLLLNQSLLEALEARRDRIDLVYERQSLWSFAGLQFAQRHRIPFFLEVNAPLTAQQREYRDFDMAETARAVERYLFSGADRVIATSPALVEYARTRGASRRKTRVIRCGVSPRMFSAPIAPSRRGERGFTLGFLGSLKPWHGVEILLEAFSVLRRLNSGYRLLIVGEGPLKSYIRDFCRTHKLGGAVSLAGGVDYSQVPSFLAQMDVGLAPYPELDSFYFSPLKVWEYAAAGVPIVASASGELPRLFPHRSAALLHPPGKVGKVVKHVERLRANPELGCRLARRARRVARLHTWDRLAARFLTLAESTLRARSSAK